MRLPVTWALLAMIVIGGCTSFRTTALYRFDNDSVTPECTNKKLKGLPVKLKVPSHVAVTIFEQQVLLAITTTTTTGTPPATESKYALVSFSPPQLMVETELVYTDKVFLVDFKRPAAGILDLTEAKMDDEQYFSNITAEVTERTINDINTSLGTLQPALTQFKKPAVPKAKATTANSPEADADNVGFKKSVIAYQRFDISEPDWECRLQEFVNCQLNRCETFCPPVTTPAPKTKAPALGSGPTELPPGPIPANSDAAFAPPALRAIFN